MLPFTKLHGLGNDFVLLDGLARELPQPLPKTLVTFIADRKRGVGFDQLLVLRPSPRVHAVLDIYNADGSMAEMCGNGLRAAALYLWETGQCKEQTITVDTAAGDRSATLLGPVSEGRIETEMGAPKFAKLPTPIANGITFTIGKTKQRAKPVLVNVGNPHAVFFVTPPKKDTVAWLTKYGAMVETHKAFPKRTNVEFVTPQSKHKVQVYVWERGVGLTEACGTGAVASAVAAIQQGYCESPVEVVFPGGSVEVAWENGRSAFLRGHAARSFDALLIEP